MTAAMKARATQAAEPERGLGLHPGLIIGQASDIFNICGFFLIFFFVPSLRPEIQYFGPFPDKNE
ncbi:MAG: hypothetical protein M0C28_46240 [Candidatus Moduliflexus flocculans]|nr:hypothetical protein [Candidatus Moduliflexus flocculans]